MSKARGKSGGTAYYSDDYFCWNACEDKLRECIDRNKFVKDIRNKLAKKKFKKIKDIQSKQA